MRRHAQKAAKMIRDLENELGPEAYSIMLKAMADRITAEVDDLEEAMDEDKEAGHDLDYMALEIRDQLEGLLAKIKEAKKTADCI